MGTLTKQQQYRTVSAGFALGLLMNGYNQIPNDKVKVELIFVSAWRQWSHRQELPAADKSIAGTRKDWDILRIITDLDKDKKQPYVPFQWDEHAPGGPRIEIRNATDFDPSNQNDTEFYAKNISDQIPVSAWKELAKNFLEKYE
ncbi:hypothetical protein [Arthrobacter sp. YC-RL1]|uniref:hypothetical protein n=1 Tax=Arthrobacter sp. YC-RL1 TaxID=1652545 RepID=UPI00128E157F|nr:hypothetical protein [Arthrobacter sp. YC-RL1]